MTGHGIDVPGNDLVQILELFVANPKWLAQAEGIDLLLLKHIDMLVDSLSHLPSHRQMILALGWRPKQSYK